MRPFEVKNAASFEEAGRWLAKGNADVLAGGTDLINVYKSALLEEHPDTVINLKSIPDAAGIEKKDGEVLVKSMTRLTAIAESKEVPKALSEAAASVATPLIRNLATIGGNVCQDVRCWYYRYPHEIGGRMDCSRKGGDTCYAIHGENRYHSVFGGMHTHGGACQNACPAGTDISGYMAKIRESDWDSAAEIILRVNPMPMLTARVCPHPCQDFCNQHKYGDAVAIHCVERTLGDYILEHKDRYYQAPQAETGKKVAIVGAGPGGLTAAYYLRKEGHDVTVYDAHEKAGGVLQYGIPHYRLPKAIVDEFAGALEGMGIRFVMNTKIGTDIPTEELVDQYEQVYFGTGAWSQPILGINGESLTEFGLNFLVEVNTYLKEKISDDVLVCGGGNVAMDVALTAKRLGAKHVTLICLEQADEMPATDEEVARAKEEGIVIHNGWGLKGVVTDAAGQVIGLESMRCLSVFDENHRFSPKYDQDDVIVYEATTILLATGQRVDTSFLGDKLGSQLKTARGLFDVDEETYQSKSNAKIFAGGDAVTGPNIAIRAIRAGGVAARNMNRRMGSSTPVPVDREGFLHYDVKGIKNPKAVDPPERKLEDRTLFDEDAETLSIEAAAGEASRCMNCGCYSVNASDIANVLVALDGTLVTTKKEIAARDFFTTKLKAYDMLSPGELITGIRVPEMEGYETGYLKDRLRPSIDFALTGLAYAVRKEGDVIADIKLAFGGVAPVPVRLTEVEEFLKGRKPDAEIAAAAGELSVKNAIAMEKNSYKIVGAKTMMERLIASL
ncbi:MAG: FAD-dependent oxidoreductase [Mogibacterium sp.]|nr:FAD-dependent oxidoreductase [Mogibacterium sp.]